MQEIVATIEPLSPIKTKEITTIGNLTHINTGITSTLMKFRINLKRNNLNF
jgi:hypothetical protein